MLGYFSKTINCILSVEGIPEAVALLLEKGKLLSSIFRCRIEFVTYHIGGRHLAIATALFYSFAITLKMIGYLHISGNHSRNIASRTYSQLTNDASQKMLPGKDSCQLI